VLTSVATSTRRNSSGSGFYFGAITHDRFKDISRAEIVDLDQACIAALDKRNATIREVAELLGYEKSSIYNMLNEGRLRCVKIGRVNRIPHSAVAEFVVKDVRPRVAYPSRTA
jgi:excisionase family DNA binding protein